MAPSRHAAHVRDHRSTQRPAHRRADASHTAAAAEHVDLASRTNSPAALSDTGLLALQRVAGNRTVRDLWAARARAGNATIAVRTFSARPATPHAVPAAIARVRAQSQVIRRQGELGEDLLREGSTGAAVEALQRMLNAAGASPGLEVDGIFGPATRAAVMEFQHSHGLDSDGLVGPLTKEQLLSFGPEAEPGDPEAVVAENIEGSETPEDELARGYPRALELHDAGRYEEALALFQRFYGLPELEDVRNVVAFDMGECYMRLGQNDRAIETFQELLLMDLGEVEREHVLEMLRRARAGEELPPADAALLPDPTADQRAEAEAIASRELEEGHALLDTDIEGARVHYLAAYNQGAATPDTRAQATAQLGVCSQYLREFDAAIGYYQELLGFPAIADDLRREALEQIRQCRRGEVTRAEPAAPLAPDQAEASLTAAQEAFNGGDYQTALAGCQAIYQNPDAPPEYRQEAAYWSGECYQRMEELDSAIPMYEESILFPGIEESYRDMVLRRIQQCRDGELGPHIEPGAHENAAPGEAELLFGAQVYFETGSAEVGSIGYSTIYEVVSLLQERHRADPGLALSIDVIGGASRRWRGAGSTVEAQRQNEILSGQRADAVQTEMENQLPTDDVEAGVYPIDPRASGDTLAESAGMDPDDNTWTMRNVGVLVLGTRTGTTPGD